MKACVLVRVRPGTHQQVAKKIALFQGVKEAYPAMGTADVVVRVDVADLAAMTLLGTMIGDLQDVVTAETLIAAEV